MRRRRKSGDCDAIVVWCGGRDRGRGMKKCEGY